jgi:hypothetical protein
MDDVRTRITEEAEDKHTLARRGAERLCCTAKIAWPRSGA